MAIRIDFQSLRFKLLAVAAISSLAGALVVLVGLAAYEARDFRERRVAEVKTLTQVVRLNLHAPLNFRDPMSTEETLATLRAFGDVEQACAYDADGRLIAAYSRETRALRLALADCPMSPPVWSEKFGDYRLEMVETVRYAEEVVGRLYTRWTVLPMIDRLGAYLPFAHMLAVALLVAAALLVWAARRLVTDPLRRLAAFAGEVNATRNYHLRAPHSGSDEISELAVAINEVLATTERNWRETRESRDLLQAIIDRAPAVIYVKDLNGRYLLVNNRFRAIRSAGLDPIGKTDVELFPSAPTDAYAVLDERVLAGEPVAFERTTREADGEHAYVAQRFALVNEEGVAFAICTVENDFTERRRDEDEIKKLVRTVAQSPVSVVMTDAEGVIEYVNPKFSQLSGFHAAEAIGRPLSEIKPGLPPLPGAAPECNDLEGGRVVQAEVRIPDRNGDMRWESVSISPIRNARGEVTHFVVLGEDISVRKSFEEQLLRQAHYDAVTGLPNRVLAMDRLAVALAHAVRTRDIVAVMFIDLDHFKNVNDTLGHESGDRLLKLAAARLAKLMRQGNTLARLGGDEFIVIAPGIAEPEWADHIAGRILNAFTRPFELDGNDLYVTASIGISLFPKDGDTPEQLLKHADIAMYKSKAGGRNASHFYTPELQSRARRRLELEGHLRSALERGEFELHYQPMFGVSDGRLVGAEALIRWVNPVLGRVPPDDFIPLAEENGTIVPIGEWVLRRACLAARRWEEAIGYPLRIAVNVSARQLRGLNFVGLVEDVIRESGLDPALLELEMTERLVLSDAPETKLMLEQLDAMGVRLSIDDFGTGYSALGYLKRYPFNVLKIDKSFVQNVLVEQSDAAVASAIVGMGHGMEMEIVAEGVETAEQLGALRDLGCDIAQGYWFSRPLPDTEFAEFLHRYRESRAGSTVSATVG